MDFQKQSQKGITDQSSAGWTYSSDKKKFRHIAKEKFMY